MPRQVGQVLENNFSKGLITENTALNFPPNACTETFDCIFDQSGIVTRRLGLDYETGAASSSVDFVDGEAFTEFIWTNVGGQSLLYFYVQQQGSQLHFYDISTDTTISTHKKSFTVDLSSHLPEGSAEDPGLVECQYALSDGDLVITNPSCETFYISYDIVSDSIDEVEIALKIRDFAGVDDGLTLNQRVTASTAGLISTNPEHYYNILNQGWHTTDALSQWDAARTDMPSNADYVGLYRSSSTDSFDNSRVASLSPGNAPAPKGHFILNVTDVDRPTAITDDGLTGVGTITSELEVSSTSGTTIGDMTRGGGIAACFTGSSSKSGASSAITTPDGVGNGYVGKDYSGLGGLRITKALVWGPNDGGYVNGANPSVTIRLWGKSSVPAHGADGTMIGTITFTDTADEDSSRTITSSDTTTHWNYVWLQVVVAGAVQIAMSLISFWTVGSSSTPEGLEPFTTTERPRTVAALNARLWYGGIDNALIGNNIYFTQIIERDEQRAFCYQTNDPTSEDLSDLLPSDGGVIRITDMGSVFKLFASRNSIMAFANNGVWLISGSGGQGFLATDYNISKLATIGCTSPQSFIDYRGIPIWWGEDGIYTVQYNQDYNSYVAVSLTDTTIREFFLSIPTLNRKFVKGIYDSTNNLIYWLYNDTEVLDSSDYYTYNGVLVLDPIAKSFYPWTIQQSTGYPVVRGGCAVQDGRRNDPLVIKYTTTLNVDADTEALTFSEHNDHDYVDWDTFAAGLDYTSYFITGYRVDGQGTRFFQPNYVFVYMSYEVDASCYMQGIFDFTGSGSSGKWSSSQQVYGAITDVRDVSQRRMKVRGKGRSMQLKFRSETGKPFSILGWAVQESVSAGV